MAPTTLFLVLNAAFAVLAAGHAVRRPFGRRGRETGTQWLDAQVRLVELAPLNLAAHAPVRVRIAATDLLATALEVATSTDSRPVRVGVNQVRELRIWMRGRLAAEVSADGFDPAGAELRPMTGRSAGWELELVTRNGELVRCYGGRLTAGVRQDLVRLHRMVVPRLRTRPQGGLPQRATARRLATGS